MERVLLQEAAAGVGWSRLTVGGRTHVSPRHLERQDIILLTIGEKLAALLPRVGSSRHRQGRHPPNKCSVDIQLMLAA